MKDSAPQTDSSMLCEALDLATLKNMMDALALAHNIGAGIFTPDLKRLVAASNHTPFCELIRTSMKDGHAIGEERCMKCDRNHFPFDGQKVKEYRCHAGNYDFAVPIVTGKGIVIGAIYGGQVRKKPITPKDIRALQKLAHVCGADEADLIIRATRLPILSNKDIGRIINLTEGIARQIAELVEKRASEHSFLVRLIGSTDLRELFSIIVEYAKSMLQATSCSIFLRYQDKTRDVLRLEHTSSEYLQKCGAVRRDIYEIGEGLTGWVAKKREALRLTNIHDSIELKARDSDLQWTGKIKEIEDYHNIKRFLAVPLIGNGEVEGVLRLVATEHRRPFEDADESTLSSLARLVWNALDAARNRDRAERHRQSMEVLSDAAAWVHTGDKNPQHFLLKIVDKGLKVLSAAEPTSMYILVHDPSKNEFIIICGNGPSFSNDEIGKRFPDATGIAGHVFKGDLHYYIANDVNKDPYYTQIVNMASALVVPIRSASGLVGVISVGSSKLGAFTTEDAENLKVFSQYAAIALSSAMTHGEAAARLDIQRTSLATFSGKGSLEPICRKIVQISAEHLQASACSLFLADGTGRLVLAASTDKNLEDRHRSKGDIWYHMGEGLTGWTAAQIPRTVVRISSVENPNELAAIGQGLVWKNKCPENLDPNAKWKSFLGIPIYFGDEHIGVIRLAQKHGSLSFIPADETILRALSDQAGICLKFARSIREKNLSLDSFAHDTTGLPVGVILDDAEALSDAASNYNKERVERIYLYARHLGILMDTHILMGMGQPIKKYFPKPVDLHEMVDQILTIAMAPYGKRQKTCNIINDIGSVFLTTDKGKLYAILYNLVKNAATACQKELKVECTELDQTIEIRIIDDGYGIDTTQIPLHVTPEHLGLHIARTFAAVLGATISYDKRRDNLRGTMTVVKVPTIPKTEAETANEGARP